jgi:hypothetical protein
LNRPLVGDDGAGCGGFFGSSPRLWWCSLLLLALFACVVCVWWRSLRRVMYNLLLLLKWHVAPAFNFKKNPQVTLVH